MGSPRFGAAGALLGVTAVLLTIGHGARGQPTPGSLAPCPSTADFYPEYRGGPCACWAPEPAPVYGTGPYASSSAICAAAVHAGALRLGVRGGPVNVVLGPGRQSYPGGSANGITAQPHGRAAGSFRIESLRNYTYGAPPRP